MPAASRRPSESAPTRLAPLSRLPVFLDLHGKRAAVIGGTPAAAWKAELLAAAGAHVAVLAAAPSDAMRSLVAQGAASGTLTLVERGWRAADLAGAALCVADAVDEAEAATLASAAAAAGVPLNVVDRPAHGGVQFGSIVNRSPVVIGISTSGAAPILGQAVRRRIELLLHPSLAAWAVLAAAVRRRMMARLAPGQARRRFWERFTDLAFTGNLPAPDAGDADALLGTVEAAALQEAMGCVTLVGAGPGDVELLTIKAVRALQAADVILVDDLVTPEVLELARREAKRVTVGKRGGRASCAQGDINGLMIRLAKQGQRVVRLKSGDPLVFGRAGEEMDQLARAGVPVEVVPGITTAMAMAAALGISLTHRDLAQSVRLITGHGRQGGLPPGLDWDGLADPGTTLVFYMAGRTAGPIADRLMQAGLLPETPAVRVTNLSRPDESRWTGTLAGLGEAARGGEGAICIGIGAVFGHAAQAGAGEKLLAG